MPDWMYREWEQSWEAAGLMTLEEFEQYNEEYRQWLDMCNDYNEEF